MYIGYSLLLIYPTLAEDLWALTPLPSVLLPVAVDSPAYPVLFSSNQSLGLPFMDLVTTTQKLGGTWSMNKILCFTTNVSPTSPCVGLYNMTMGDFHGNATNGTVLGMGFLAPLIYFKSQLDPSTISRLPLAQYPMVSRLPTLVGLPIPWEHCQPVISSINAGDYMIQPNNLKLGMWMLTALTVSCLVPRVLREPIQSQSELIKDN